MKTYQIDEIKIEWGETLSNVRTILEKKKVFNSHGGWPNIRCSCIEVFGLQTTEVEIRAPFEDRPVMQVIYEIAPIKKDFFQKSHSPYLEQLTKVLGKPVKHEKMYNQPLLKKEFLWSAVVFSATWLFEDIRISLSVYGGERNNDSGPSAAGIFIDWIDEKEAAKPYRQLANQIEKDISGRISNDLIIEKFKLEYKQKRFKVIHYELKDPYIAEDDVELRAAQISLYKPELLQTPEIIQDKLNEYEICVYKIPRMNEVFVSNKWDTTLISLDKMVKLTFYEILPARGPGGKQLNINDLSIEDSKNSNSLLNLIEKFEGYGIKVQKETRYDD
jgi:hypothetical protein